MNYYHEEYLKVQEEFHEVMHDFPLFKETIDEIYDKDIKEINDLLDKDDEYYLKKAIGKLKDLIKYIKDTSTSIDSEYERFDKLAKTWDEIRIISDDDEFLDKINAKVMMANKYIKSHDLNEIKEANKIMEELIKEVKNHKY